MFPNNNNNSYAPPPMGNQPSMGMMPPPMGNQPPMGMMPPMGMHPSMGMMPPMGVPRAEQDISISKHQEIEVPWGSDLQIGLGWEMKNGRTVDLDASAVLYDASGILLDAVFFNQLQTKDGSMFHSGDNRNGLGAGDDEAITIVSSKIHPSVSAIAIVINAFRGGNFDDVESTHANIRDLTCGVKVVSVNLPNCSGHHTALILAMLYRTPAGTWRVRNTYKKAEGRTFVESEYKIRKLLSKLLNIPLDIVIRNYNYADRSFNLEKNMSFYLPNVEKIRLGLGWDVNKDGGCSLDLDGSVISFGDSGQIDDSIIYFGHKENLNKSIVHSGDNLTGAGEGDDEQIFIKLRELPKPLHSMFFTVNVYTLNKTFESVKNAYVRLVDCTNEKEICRYSLSDCGNSNALVLAKMSRDGDEWKVQALGESMTGRTWRDLVPLLKGDAAKEAPRVPRQPVQVCKETHVVVVEAKDLPAMDRGGTSDPYVKLITPQNVVHKTAYIKKTLNPVWNTKFTLDAKVDSFVCEVYDHDTFSDDVIGMVKISLQDIPFDQEITVCRKVLKIPNNLKSPGGGELYLRILRTSKWVDK